MNNLTIEFTHPPFGYENTFAGMYVAMTSLAKGMNVTVILHGDGVYNGIKGQIDPENNINMRSTEWQLKKLLSEGGRIVAYRDAMAHRGILQEEILDGIELMSSPEIYDILIDETDKILVF